jgi:F0F1-type ATP synthase membrane subunit c/vacuolar-type H+-ATPase subunit K
MILGLVSIGAGIAMLARIFSGVRNGRGVAAGLSIDSATPSRDQRATIEGLNWSFNAIASRFHR